MRNQFADEPLAFRNPAPLDSIRTFIFDVDGVLTNGLVWCTGEGEKLRSLHSKDTYAIQLAVKMGFLVCIISGGSAAGIKERMNLLGVEHVYTHISNKADILEEFIKKYSLQHEEILYIGDDIPDLQVMHRVGVSACPSDASSDVLSVAHYVSQQPGGMGCVREILERVLKIQHKWYTPEALRW
jgi:3-deoxy-D-manno-octulosonate 8-phosphate phosphatase (KDO 8-P phosphatase)